MILRDGFQATSLDGAEVVRLVDACIRHQDHFSGGAGMELLQLWGKHAPLFVSNQVCDMYGWAKGSLGQAYMERTL